MAFTLDPQTGKITFGVVSDGTNDAISRDIASEFGVSEDFNDDFVTSTEWSQVGTLVTVNTGTQVVDWSSFLDGSNNSLVHDLGSTVSDTNWVLRFKYRADTLTAGSTKTKYFWIGLFDQDESAGSGTTQDAIAFEFFVNSTLSVGRFSLSERDGVILNGAGTDTALTTTPSDELGNDLFVELKRTSSTTAELNLYSDANYSILVENASLTIPAGIINLRYIGLKNRTDPVNTGSMTGIIDDIQFWDGITVPVITSVDWRLRFKLDITNLDDGLNATDKRLWMQMSDSDAIVGSGDAQDSLNLFTAFDTGTNRFFLRDTDGSAPSSAGNDATFSSGLLTVGTKFMEIKRTSDTAYEATLYSDSGFTTVIESQSGTTSSAVTALKYLKFMNDETLSGAGAIDGTIDDITFIDLANGVEKDKTFLVDAFVQALGDNGCSIIFADDFANATNWTQTGTQVTIASGEIQGWGADATAQRVTHDLVTPLNDSNWRVEFEFEFSAENNTAHDILVLTDTDTTSSTLQNHIACRFGSSNNPVFALLHGVNGAIGSGTADATNASTGVRYFCRLERLSSTSARLTIFTTGFDVTTFATINVTLASGLTGLQFIISETSDLGGAGRTLTGIIDNLSVKGCKTFTADALLQSLGENGSCISTYTNDMSSSAGWVSTDTTAPGFADILGGELSWESLADSTNDTIAIDLSDPSRLGSVLDDTSFRVRFKERFVTVGLLANFNHHFAYVSDSSQTTNAGIGSEDAIGFHTQIGGGGPSQIVNAFYKDSSSTVVNVGVLNTITSGQTRFYEVIRNSATSVTWNVYSDPAYTVLTDTVTSAVPATVTGLKFFKAGNWDFGNLANLLIGRIDDLDILNTGSTGNVGCVEVDAILLIQTIDLEFDVNAILKIIVDEDFIVDAFPQATQTFNFTIDGLLFITPSKLTCVDAFLQDIFDEDFTVDGRLAVRETFEADARLVNRFDEDFIVDAFLQATFTPDIEVDGRLIVRKTTTFDIDGFTQAMPQIPKEFDIDAIIRYGQGSATDEFGAIPDLIVRVLRENGTLTGRGIVDEIVIITTAEDFPFRGKNSRIKNWLNRLRLDGLTQEDGSSPDWYKTIWSLV